jgi:hypothetical protein
MKSIDFGVRMFWDEKALLMAIHCQLDFHVRAQLSDDQVSNFVWLICEQLREEL